MIGTQTASSPVMAAYAILLLAVMTGFAAYDLYKMRVPNLALAFSIPVFQR